MDLRTEQRFPASISYVKASANGRPSELPLIDATNRNRLHHEPALLSSVPFGWRGIIVEWHRLKPQEIPQHYVAGHGLAVSTGVEPIPFGWLQTFDEISLVLDREFVAHVVREELAADRVEFATQRSTPDAIVARYAEA